MTLFTQYKWRCPSEHVWLTSHSQHNTCPSCNQGGFRLIHPLGVVDHYRAVLSDPWLSLQIRWVFLKAALVKMVRGGVKI